jgi:uncharacterized protein
MIGLLKASFVLLTVGLPSSAAAFQAPALKGQVNDYANLLTPDQRNALESKLKAFESKTSAQVVVLTTTSMQGLSIDEYAVKTFAEWKLGQKGVDNGLLIVYSTDGDHYRIEVGYGLEGAIPDGKAGEILRRDLRGHADPKKGTRDFNAAFNAATDAVTAIIAAEYAKDPSGKSLKRKDIGPIILALVIGLVMTVVMSIIHPIVGGIGGGASGMLIAVLGAFSPGGLVLIGIIVGLLIKPILESAGNSDFGGFGGFSDSGSGSFSGGGGGSGGGGASD